MSHFHNEAYKLEVLKKLIIAWVRVLSNMWMCNIAKTATSQYIYTYSLFAMVNNK